MERGEEMERGDKSNGMLSKGLNEGREGKKGEMTR